MNKLFIFIFAFIIGCSPVTSSSFLYSSESLSNKNASVLSHFDNHAGIQDDTLSYLLSQVSCSDFNSAIWDHIYITLFSHRSPPPTSLIHKKIKKSAQQFLSLHGAQPYMIRDFSDKLTKFYKNTFRFFADKPEEVILKELADIEYLSSISTKIQDSYIHPDVKEFVEINVNLLNEVKKIILPLDLGCDSQSPQTTSIKPLMNTAPSNSLLYNMQQQLHPLVYGARKVMATAYQSCEVLNLPLVPKNYPGVRGVIQSSYQRDGGYARSISSLSSVNRSHYYLAEANQYTNQQCMNLSRNPIIYDYGGKPYFSSLPQPSINLFKNAGSGGKVLGIDCSGFVLSALASAGLRIRAHQTMRGPQISGISSWTFRQASPSRLSCLNKTLNSYYSSILLAGDIIAMYGHVMIVDQIPQNQDPLGLSRITRVSQCHPSKISSKNFNFSIIQSSATFNGLGINRVHVQHANNPKLISGLKEVASIACYKKFNKPNRKKSASITILRHSETPECKESEVHLTGQECLYECSSQSSHT